MTVAGQSPMGAPRCVPEDETFHFCSEKCQNEIQADRGSNATAEAQAPKGAPADGPVYLPDASLKIIPTRPVPAPICGMAAGTDGSFDEPSEERPGLYRRMWTRGGSSATDRPDQWGGLVGLPVRDWIGHQNGQLP